MWDLIESVSDHCLSFYSVAEQASWSLTWSETPEDTYSHDEAHVNLQFLTPRKCLLIQLIVF